MPSIQLKLLRTNDPAPALELLPHVRGLYRDTDWTAVLIEAGMASGEPSVALIVAAPTEDDPEAVILLETSLLIFRAAARALEGMAATQLGWTLPA